MRNSNIRKSPEKSRSRIRKKTSPSSVSAASTGKLAGPGAAKVYYATISHNGRIYGVDFVDMPGCISAGDTFEEAIAGAHEALRLHVRGLRADGDPVPVPSPLERVQAVAKSEMVAADNETLQFSPIVLLEDRLVERNPALRVNITMQQNLLSSVDAWAAQHGETRSSMLAKAARERMKRGV